MDCVWMAPEISVALTVALTVYFTCQLAFFTACNNISDINQLRFSTILFFYTGPRGLSQPYMITYKSYWFTSSEGILKTGSKR